METSSRRESNRKILKSARKSKIHECPKSSILINIAIIVAVIATTLAMVFTSFVA